LHWAKLHRQEIKDLLKKHGAILFRNFPIANATAFSKFQRSLGIKPHSYEGGTSLRNLVSPDAENVYTTNESPPEVPIDFHHEMAYSHVFPKTITFFAETITERGGTPLLDSQLFYQKLSEIAPDFVTSLGKQPIIYKFPLQKYKPMFGFTRGWAEKFHPDEKEAKRIAEKHGTMLIVNPVDDSAVSVTKCPAILQHNEYPVFFNSLQVTFTAIVKAGVPFHKVCSFENGTHLDVDGLQKMSDLMKEMGTVFAYEQNDVLLVDN
jgi:hypothetical protein